MADGLEGTDRAAGPTPPPDGGRREQGEADGGGGVAEVLERSRALGFLGPGPVADHLRHAQVFAAALRSAPAPAPVDGVVRVLDLGSGGGLPGLVLATDPGFAGWRWVLADAAQ